MPHSYQSFPISALLHKRLLAAFSKTCLKAGLWWLGATMAYPYALNKKQVESFRLGLQVGVSKSWRSLSSISISHSIQKPRVFHPILESPESCVKKLVVTHQYQGGEKCGSWRWAVRCERRSARRKRWVSQDQSLQNPWFPTKMYHRQSPILFLHKYLPDNKQGNLMAFSSQLPKKNIVPF